MTGMPVYSLRFFFIILINNSLILTCSILIVSRSVSLLLLSVLFWLASYESDSDVSVTVGLLGFDRSFSNRKRFFRGSETGLPDAGNFIGDIAASVVFSFYDIWTDLLLKCTCFVWHALSHSSTWIFTAEGSGILSFISITSRTLGSDFSIEDPATSCNIPQCLSALPFSR